MWGEFYKIWFQKTSFSKVAERQVGYIEKKREDCPLKHIKHAEKILRSFHCTEAFRFPLMFHLFGIVTTKYDLFLVTFARMAKASWLEIVFEKGTTECCQSPNQTGLSQTVFVTKKKGPLELQMERTSPNLVVSLQKNHKCSKRISNLTMAFVLSNTIFCIACENLNSPQDLEVSKKCLARNKERYENNSLSFDVTKEAKMYLIRRIEAFQLETTHILSNTFSESQPIWGVSLSGTAVSAEISNNISDCAVNLNWMERNYLKYNEPQKCHSVFVQKSLHDKCWNFSSVENGGKYILFFVNKATLYSVCSNKNDTSTFVSAVRRGQLFRISSLHLVHNLVSWIEAAETCSQATAHLPVFRDKQELHDFTALVKQYARYYFSRIEFVYIRLVKNNRKYGNKVSLPAIL